MDTRNTLIDQSEGLNDDIVNLSYYTKNTHMVKSLETIPNTKNPLIKSTSDNLFKKIMFYPSNFFNKFTE